MHDQREPDPRREAIRDMLTAYGQAVTEEEIGSVLAALDREPRYDGWRYHKETARPFGADPADTSY